MAIAVDSKITASQIQLHVPASYHKALMQRKLRWLLRYYALLLIGYALIFAVAHAYHRNWNDNTLSTLITAAFITIILDPILSLSHSHWVYVLDDTGLFLRDNTNPIHISGIPMFRSKDCTVVIVEASHWRDYPALTIDTIRPPRKPAMNPRHHQHMVVFNASDKAIAQALLQRLSLLYPRAIIAPELREI